MCRKPWNTIAISTIVFSQSLERCRCSRATSRVLLKSRSNLSNHPAPPKRISEFQWACDGCLRSGKAIIAHPEKQTFCSRPPFLAYFDSEKICNTCKQVFLFWAKEQVFWYETLKFWVQSKAKNCPTCRKKARERKNQNTYTLRYSSLACPPSLE